MQCVITSDVKDLAFVKSGFKNPGTSRLSYAVSPLRDSSSRLPCALWSCLKFASDFP